MTKEQGWMILALLAAIGAFLAYQHTSKGPSAATKALMNHERIMCQATGAAQHCAEHKRLREKYY
ncbi:hypothetical protein [Aquamicrobium zhengzhouense]|uniref:Uncharacterized protein n=1 Tax=Aquamicrobium zhengzhouense TaxID=2781738 RepID=A0ABS0S9T7_9HYPH|nr:hypothetical protein [Aquamicrobium zhengzhouense]MBI1620055.1 hypothetical protein [Aquamicrobium zhengzhouense]